MSDDADQLAQLGRELPRIDLDDQRAQRIAHRARGSVGRGRPLTRFVEPALVVLFETSVMMWVLVKVVEVLR